MFTQLEPLLKDGRTLSITCAREDETKLRLTITEFSSKTNGNGDNGHESMTAILNKPRVIIATPAELDAELPDALTAHVETVTGVRASLTALEATFEAEKKAADKRIADEKKRGPEKKLTPAAAAKPAAVVAPAKTPRAELTLL